MSVQSESCKIWKRFELKLKDGSVIKVRIQDLPLNRHDDALEFLTKYYMAEESFHVAAGICKREEAIQECRELKNHLLESPDASSVICCLDDPYVTGEIIGVSFMELIRQSENKDKLNKTETKTEELKNLLQIIKIVSAYTGDKEFETYYRDRGLAVHPDYRNLGLANAFLSVRELVCVEQKVPITYSWMTAMGTQKAAEKNTWKTIVEISIEELENVTGFVYEKTVPSVKYMYKIIDQQ